ncbi:MAG: hypothetical protein RL226_156 [Bacteroidota bacterium]
MKNFKHIIALFILALATVLTGCQKMDDLEPVNSVELETRRHNDDGFSVDTSDKPGAALNFREGEIRDEGDGPGNINDDDDDEDDDEIQSLNRN